MATGPSGNCKPEAICVNAGWMVAMPRTLTRGNPLDAAAYRKGGDDRALLQIVKALAEPPRFRMIQPPRHLCPPNSSLLGPRPQRARNHHAVEPLEARVDGQGHQRRRDRTGQDRSHVVQG